MSRVLISWTTAFQQDVFGSFGKLATIWFDDVAFQTPRKDFLGSVLDRLSFERKLETSEADALREVWKPVHTLIPEYHFLGFVENEAWMQENEHLWEIAYGAVSKQILEAFPNANPRSPGFQHEARWATYGALDTIGIWGELNKSETFGILQNPEASQILRHVFQAIKTTNSFALFSEIVDQRIPDFSTLRWSEVLELREHPHLESFRKKLTFIQQSAKDLDRTSLLKMTEEIERHDLQRLARLVRPSTKKTTAKFIVNNLPLPIPVNPLSLGSDAIDIAQSVNRNKEFGWLYFLIDLEGTSS